MQGRNTNFKIPAITHDDQIITNSQDIADTFAEHFHAKSKNISTPQTLHTTHQIVPPDSDSLNSAFSLNELKLALTSCKNSAAGPDDIPFIFLKNLSDASLNKLLELYNKIWTSQEFPAVWRQSIILPFKKNDSSSTHPNAYRPISLTCTMCKLLEKMINKRLLWYLEKNNLLNQAQSGFRPHRSTTDNLVALQTEIADAFAIKQDVVAVVFDIESAFDTTWRPGIYNKLKEINLTGSMLSFLNNFLTNRTFKVTTNGKSSQSFTLENGVPQGSVLSTTLFILAINDICTAVSAPVKYALFADDLILYCTGKVTSTTCDLLQNSVNDLTHWTRRTGFNFSASKSKVIKFSRGRNRQVPHISLNGEPLQVVDQHKFLGLTFDSRLTWAQHIKDLKQNCANRLNILRTLSHHQWGAEEQILLRIYRSLVRSKLDYGSIIYSSASRSNLKSLDAVHNSALRICLGAFRSSPTESLYCESHELPLSLRREQLLLTYSASVSANPKNPNYEAFISVKPPPPYSPRRLLSIPQTLKPLLGNNNLRKTSANPISPIPPWIKVLPSINVSLHKQKKNETCNTTLQQAFRELINSEKFQNILYTDASKGENGITCAATATNPAIACHRLPAHSSIHTGELYAILTALKSTTDLNGTTTAICTDSLASIYSIQNMYTQNPLVQSIHEICHQLSAQGNSITIVWVPSHVGISGNERADQLAKQALESDLPVTEIHLQKDLKNLLKQTTIDKWQNLWSQTNTKLSTIQPKINSSELPSMTRRDKIILRRLRIGHTRTTHGYLMEAGNPPVCEHCNSLLTVKHILTECPHYSEARRYNNLKADLKEDLSSPKSSDIINFLRAINMYPLL